MVHPIIKPLIRRYSTCRRCLIGCISPSRIHYRGDVKCDILFVGDGPNDIDVVFQEPFSGPPGKLLNSLIDESGLSSYRINFTNAIICVPTEKAGGRIRTIKKSEITNCSSRLQEFISLVKPTIIVAVGAIADQALTKLNLHFFKIPHPSAIIRQEEQGDIDMARVLATFKSIKFALSEMDRK